MKLLVINGPNLNMLGKRDCDQYGSCTLDEIKHKLEQVATGHNISLEFFQSNHEGALIDYLQNETSLADGILINPGALTHYGYSLRDALADTRLPIVEVHLSDITNREDFRKIDVLDGIVISRIQGLKEQSYTNGLEELITYITNKEGRVV